MHTSIHPYIQPSIYPFIHQSILRSGVSAICASTYPSNHSFIHSSIHSPYRYLPAHRLPVHLYLKSCSSHPSVIPSTPFTHLSIHPSILPLILSSIHPFIHHPTIRPPIVF